MDQAGDPMTSNPESLVDRLREAGKMYIEAADEIDRLTRERQSWEDVARDNSGALRATRGDRNRLRGAIDDYLDGESQGNVTGLRQALDATRSETEKLRGPATATTPAGKDVADRNAFETPECICPTCGIRHGGSTASGEF